MIQGYDKWKLASPQDRKPVATDWQGEELYEGDECYCISGELVLRDELMDFIGESITLGGYEWQHCMN